MSRFTAKHLESGSSVAYGLDHVEGWFYQEFDRHGECIIDEDTRTTGLSKSGLIERLEHTTAPKEHKENIALDLDPGLGGR